MLIDAALTSHATVARISLYRYSGCHFLTNCVACPMAPSSRQRDACKLTAVYDSGRCHWHGGCSTEPTVEKLGHTAEFSGIGNHA